MLQKRKKFNKQLILLIIIICVTICSYILHKLNNDTYKDNTTVLNTITKVIELNTVKYNYSNVITVQKDKSFKNIKIPFTNKSFIIKYNGIIKGGIESQDINIVKNTGNEISIEIDKCRILDHYIDDENIYVYDASNSIFNKLEAQEVLDELNASKKEYEQKIINEGFMEEIENITKISLVNMLENIGYQEITITFK